MDVTTPILTTSHRAVRSTLLRTTVGVGLGAAAVATAAAAAVHAAGVPLAVGGEMIPLAGFAQMTFIGAVAGGLIAALVRRRGVAARERFVRIAVVLTALSCIPSVDLPPDAATKLALVVIHVIAATIIVPVLTRQLDA